jgi:hypothetical protein
MTFALQSRLVAEFKGRPQAESTEDEEPDARPIELLWQGEARGGLIRRRQMRGIIQRVGRARGLDQETLERLDTEARERLEDDDLHEILMSRPTGEVLALICADLGLEPDWERISKEPWAQHEIACRRSGSPLIDWMANQAPEAHEAPPPLVPSG